MKFKWKGVFPAVTTKFTDNDELDFAAFDHNINAQLEAGVDGLILGGSLGEASVLSDEEKYLYCSTSPSKPRKRLLLVRKRHWTTEQAA
jgi:dihydrodipicolinate synthase/N-acetylneuraminate lyase